MTEFGALNTQDFQTTLYPQLNHRLKSTPWNSSASEAHGLLTGLVCRGITAREIVNKMYLLKISDTEDVAVLTALFDLILRDLQSDELTFNILLPDDQAGTIQKADEISNWCTGYLQGFYHDGETAIRESSATVQELIQDIFDITRVALEYVEEESDDDQKSLVEIEEYLRVAIPVIYDEVADKRSDSTAPGSANH